MLSSALRFNSLHKVLGGNNSKYWISKDYRDI